MKPAIKGCVKIVVGLLFVLSAWSQEVKEATAKELLDAIRQHEAKLVVVNFYATWCPPCVAEFPHFVKFRRKHVGAGVEVFFMSADFPDDKDKVIAFLKKQKVNWISFLKAGKDDDFIKSIHADWTGSLPATAFYSGNGKLLAFHQGRLSYQDLNTEAQRHLRTLNQQEVKKENDK